MAPLTDWVTPGSAAPDVDRELVRLRRVQYESAGIDAPDLASTPIEQWYRWHADAAAAGVAEPNAMVLGTVDPAGVPDARVLLVRDVSEAGFTFFTNYESVKSAQLAANPAASAVFSWLDLHRQVRVRGRVTQLDEAASDAYFASRPRGSQIGAWASPQSQVLTDRSELDARVSEIERRFEGIDVTRPPFWGGWRLVPDSVEFWQGRPNRLHDRLRYDRSVSGWSVGRLAP